MVSSRHFGYESLFAPGMPPLIVVDTEMNQGLRYKPGIDRIEEAVISSHFMHDICRDPGNTLYGADEFSRSAVEIRESDIESTLLPCLLRASEAFAARRAEGARRRARDRQAPSSRPDAADCITELLFDPGLRSGRRETCDRQELVCKVRSRIRCAAPIDMVVSALPHKLSSPLKTRGRRADLAEADFLLGLY